jgi:hypothetical protein
MAGVPHTNPHSQQTLFGMKINLSLSEKSHLQLAHTCHNLLIISPNSVKFKVCYDA